MILRSAVDEIADVDRICLHLEPSCLHGADELGIAAKSMWAFDRSRARRIAPELEFPDDISMRRTTQVATGVVPMFNS